MCHNVSINTPSLSFTAIMYNPYVVCMYLRINQTSKLPFFDAIIYNPSIRLAIRIGITPTANSFAKSCKFLQFSVNSCKFLQFPVNSCQFFSLSHACMKASNFPYILENPHCLLTLKPTHATTTYLRLVRA